MAFIPAKWGSMIKKLAVTLVAATALLTSSTTVASAAPAQARFRAEALASGLTAAQAASLQQKVDGVLASIPGGKQVSATRINYDGLVVTFDPHYSAAMGENASVNSLICTDGWLCMVVRGVTFSYYKCQSWSLSNWWGTGPYYNNQSKGTVARFYDKSWNELWTTTAKEEGEKDWTPFWFLTVC
jgi:hypothetical protein